MESLSDSTTSSSSSTAAPPATSISTFHAVLPAAIYTSSNTPHLSSINGVEKNEHSIEEESEGGEGGGRKVVEGGEVRGAEKGGGEGEGESGHGLSVVAAKINQIPALNMSISMNPRCIAPTAECPICLEEPGLPLSVITTCGHILCLVCAKLLIKVNKKCPICSCPLGEKDYVGLSRLQQKDMMNNNDGNNINDNHSHEDGKMIDDVSEVGNKVAISTRMEVIHLEESESNCRHDVEINVKRIDEDKVGRAAAADGIRREMIGSGSDGDIGGRERERGDMDVGAFMESDAVRAGLTVTNTTESTSRESHAQESVARTGTGIEAGTGTGAKENYRTDDYRRWGGERFHKTVSLVCSYHHCLPFLEVTLSPYRHHTPAASSVQLRLSSSNCVPQFL